MKYKIVVDKQSRSNPSSEKIEYEIDIEELRAKGDVCDSLVITNQETYVMRRLSLSKYNVLSVLKEPIKEKLEEVNIVLFEGDNYIYIMNETGNYICAQYLTNNDLNNTFATRVEMNAAIKLSANEINQEVKKKVNEKDLTGAYLILRINGDTSEAKLNADKIELSANDILNIIANNTINLTTKNIEIDSNNFKLDRNGNVEAKNATISGGYIDLCTTDDTKTSAFLQIRNTESINEKLEAGSSFFRLSAKDNSAMIDMNINNYDDSGQIVPDFSISDSYNNATVIAADGVSTKNIWYENLIPLSQEKKKKNIKKADINASNIILNSEIYTFNYKKDGKNEKERYGFVIGKKYKTPEEVIYQNKGVDLYSMVSIVWKGMQEQQEEIKELKEEIKKLKEAQNG